MEERHGPSAGARQYIRVLQLLAQHPVQRVQRAIRQGRAPETLSADCIIQNTFRLAKRDGVDAGALDGVQHDDPVRAVQVRMPNLQAFDQLLSSGERAYV
jgi:hypothetical protein